MDIRCTKFHLILILLGLLSFKKFNRTKIKAVYLPDRFVFTNQEGNSVWPALSTVPLAWIER